MRLPGLPIGVSRCLQYPRQLGAGDDSSSPDVHRLDICALKHAVDRATGNPKSVGRLGNRISWFHTDTLTLTHDVSCYPALVHGASCLTS
jgi:hypothetical protein